jgi:hypothetical protein
MVEDGVAPAAVGPLSQEEQEEEEDGAMPRPDTFLVDDFGLDVEKFVQEQERTPWMRELKVFL